jgi:hypothetical protein
VWNDARGLARLVYDDDERQQLAPPEPADGSREERDHTWSSEATRPAIGRPRT